MVICLCVIENQYRLLLSYFFDISFWLWPLCLLPMSLSAVTHDPNHTVRIDHIFHSWIQFLPTLSFRNLGPSKNFEKKSSVKWRNLLKRICSFLALHHAFWGGFEIVWEGCIWTSTFYIFNPAFKVEAYVSKLHPVQSLTQENAETHFCVNMKADLTITTCSVASQQKHYICQAEKHL